MFKVVDDLTFTHSVTARVPVDGGHDEQEFKATFKVMPVDQVDNYDLKTVEGATEFLARVVVSMSELADEKGKDLAYNDDVRSKVLQMPYARKALLDAYSKGVSGARTGN